MLYVIIVTFNGYNWISECLNSLKKSDFNYKVIVIDNGSEDGTIELLDRSFKEVLLIKSEKNLGFGKANNIGIKIALDNNAEFIFLLNQDAYLYRGSLDNSIKILNKGNKIGILSPIHLAGNKKDFDFAFYEYVRPEFTPDLLGSYFTGNLEDYYPTNFVNAAAWLIKAEIIKKIGYFHPVFPHYGEDDEYVSRLKKAGYSICIDPNLFIIHDRPQHRADNKYFKPYLAQYRIALLEFFRYGKVNKFEMLKNFTIEFSKNLYSLNLRNLPLFPVYYFKTFLTIRKIKKGYYSVKNPI
ncbi:glycosyltransferase family 2 protein [Litoribacter populi]|uniref:glycosyltransferase family 2 protein n=1 Tax=Litoribacter populi TaxID=2598460 RepID=UPI0011812C0B|nr:glycosyltransferase family 2 protein [Litoribacter populi]